MRGLNSGLKKADDFELGLGGGVTHVVGGKVKMEEAKRGEFEEEKKGEGVGGKRLGKDVVDLEAMRIDQPGKKEEPKKEVMKKEEP